MGATGITNGTLSDKLSTLLELFSGKGVMPASVLAKALHLAKLSDPVISDPHLKKAQDLVLVFSPQNIQDILVNKAQFAPVRDPLPQTIWCKILLDSYVDFEKLFASMEKGYDYHDDPKDFGAGYALIKKDQAFQSGCFVQKLIGCVFSVHGLQVYLFSFLTVNWNFETIRQSLWTCFELPQ